MPSIKTLKNKQLPISKHINAQLTYFLSMLETLRALAPTTSSLRLSLITVAAIGIKRHLPELHRLMNPNNLIQLVTGRLKMRKCLN